MDGETAGGGVGEWGNAGVWGGEEKRKGGGEGKGREGDKKAGNVRI